MPQAESGHAHDAARTRLAAAIAKIDAVLPGSVVIRHVRCGKPGCRCQADPPTLHGPYNQWTRTVAGKTVTKLLTDEQVARYQPWFDNARRLRELTRELEALSLQAAQAAEGWAAAPSAETGPPQHTQNRQDRQGDSPPTRPQPTTTTSQQHR